MTELASSYSFPDPRSWLRAAMPPALLSEFDSWASWIPDLVALTDLDWSQSDRERALAALRAGRMVRIPCGPQPAYPFSNSSNSEGSLEFAWLAWSAEPCDRRDNDDSWESHVYPWARMAASRAGFKGSWRYPHIDAIVMVLVLMSRLDRLRFAYKANTAGEVADAFTPTIHQAKRKAVWRECVRIRQYLADVLPFAENLPRGAKGSFKYWWFSCLEWTRQAEMKGAALWDGPVVLSGLSRSQILWQRWFGKLAFR